VRSETTSFYLFDALGSTAKLTSSAGAVTDGYLYDSFGNILSTSGTTTNWFRYIGQLGYYLDTDLAGYYLRLRLYDPMAGRFRSPDPLRRNLLWQADLQRCGSLYGYVINNPMNSTDPSGLAPCAPFPLGCAASLLNCSHYLTAGHIGACGYATALAEFTVCMNAPPGAFGNCMRACLQRCEVGHIFLGCATSFCFCHASCGLSCSTTPAAPSW
jgi:RHS repeat-associated protein